MKSKILTIKKIERRLYKIAQYNIFRPLSSEEKVDTIQLGSDDLLSAFLKELAKKQAEYQKKMRPYDSYSAKIDFESKIRNKIDEITQNVSKEGADRTIDFGNLDEYGKLERFKFIERTKSEVTKLVAGTLNTVLTGHRYRFICKPKGNRISIYVDNEKVDEFEKWLKEEFLKEDDDIKEGEVKQTPEEKQPEIKNLKKK